MTGEEQDIGLVDEGKTGTFAVTIDPDLMSAYLTITPIAGGSIITADQIAQALKEQGVLTGILYEEIENALTDAGSGRWKIAAGFPPQPGENSQFVSLIPEMKERCPLAEADGHVDYRNMGDIVSVKAGDPLMRRLPPTRGIPGENLLGQPVSAPDGMELAYAPNLAGTIPSPDDSDLLLAEISGLPVLVERGVIVEPVLKVKTVDLASGNLHFTGTIQISGDVKAGMEVTATGDITIGGVAESARIEAEGDIEIKGGIIGQKEVRNDKGELNTGIAFIHAKGSVTAQFAENACIQTGRDVHVREVAMKSDITAGNTITVGEKGMRKGHIIGGICRAATCVHAIVAGSPANVVTRIEVGMDPAMHEKLSMVEQQLTDKEKRQEEIDKTLAYIRENSATVDPGFAALKERVHALLQAEIVELVGQKKRLQKRLELVDNARIEIEGTTYFGVQIVIGNKMLLVEDDLLAKTFSGGEDGIVY